MSPGYLAPLLAWCLLAGGQSPPVRPCCEHGYTLSLYYPDGAFRPRCTNSTGDDYDDYYYEEGIVDSPCKPENLRSVAADTSYSSPLTLECADVADDGEQQGRLVGLYCDVVYFRCCRGGSRYDPDHRVCVGESPDDALVGVRGGNASRAFRELSCADRAVVDDFVAADVIEIISDGRLVSPRELKPRSFCVEGTTLGEEVIVLRYCQDVRQACSERRCFRKCCADGTALEESGNCAPSDMFAVSSLPATYDVAVDGNLSVAQGFAVAVGKDCPTGKYLVDPAVEPVELAANGDLLHDGSVLDVDSYCADAELDSGAVVVLRCFPEDTSAVPVYTTVGMIVSSVFLLATLLVYALLPALLNLHGKTLMCHVVSLLVAYVCLSCTHLSVKAIYETGWCTAVAYIMIFSFMAAFSWLNVMCFDIWWTFRLLLATEYVPSLFHLPAQVFRDDRSITVRCLTQGSRQQREQRRFMWYNLYSWSLATCVVLVTCAADTAGDLLPQPLRPLIGNETCFYSHTTHSQKVFFELPVAALTVSNIVFFVLTARNCYKVKAELQRLQSKEGERGKRRFQAHKSKLITTAKLFVVMGVTWVMEFTASLFATGNEIWIPADIANSLQRDLWCWQGFFIFCIFVLKRKVLQNLRKRLRVKTCLQRDGAADSGSSGRARGTGYDLWRMRKISSNSTLYTNSTTLVPGSRNK